MYRSWTIVLLLNSLVMLFAQNSDFNIQQIAAYEQVVPDPEYDRHPGFGDAVLSNGYLYINAHYHFMSGPDVYLRLMVANVSEPWRVNYLDHRRQFVVNEQAGIMKKFGDKLYMSHKKFNLTERSSQLRVSDISNPIAPGPFRGDDFTPNFFSDMTKVGNYIYAGSGNLQYGNGESFTIIRDDATPTLLTSDNLYGPIHGIATNSNLLFLGNDSSGLRILDISSDPENPVEVTELPIGERAFQVAYDDNYVYLANDSSGLRVIDVSSPASPMEVASLPNIGILRRLAKSGDLLFATGDQQLHVIDVSDPLQPQAVGRHQLEYSTLGLSAEGAMVAVTSYSMVGLYSYHAGSGPILSVYNALITQECRSNSPYSQSGFLELRNTGDAPLIISSITTRHPTITVDDSTLTIQPGAINSINVNFHFLARAANTDYLVIEHNGASSPDTARLYGCPHPPAPRLANFYFGDLGTVFLGDTVVTFEDIQIENRTNFINPTGSFLNILATTDHPDLSISPTSASLRSYDGNGYFRPTFIARQPGPFNANVIFHHNGGRNPITVPIFGIVETAVDIKGADKPAIPKSFALDQNYPNPFNPETTIGYSLPKTSEVQLDIFSIEGRQVRSLQHGQQPAGYYRVSWDGKDDAGQKVSSGFYIYRLKAGEFVRHLKMSLVK